MRNESIATEIGNRAYQQQMAKNLILSLGIDDAIDACLENDWIGTLGIILKDNQTVSCH